jgi:hypothetical protein
MHEAHGARRVGQFLRPARKTGHGGEQRRVDDVELANGASNTRSVSA